MSRLDHHIALVQGKLAFSSFLDVAARAVAIAGSVVVLAIIVDRVFLLRPPHAIIWFWSVIIVSLVCAIVFAIRRRPTPEQAAMQIDQALNTKDKFATALYVRRLNDPFAQAVQVDAERAAQNADLKKKFAIRFPKAAYITLAVASFAVMTHYSLDPLDLFGKKAADKKRTDLVAQITQSKKVLTAALTTVDSVPKALREDPAVKLARESVLAQLNQPSLDPERAQRTAAKALQDLNDAIKSQIKTNDKFVEAQNDAKMLKQLQSPGDEKGPVADAQRELAKGNFNEALNELNKTVEKFDKMDEKEQEKAAEQMKKMANQLQQMANNPQQADAMKQQMQQAGMTQKQADQAQQLVQQAAQGDKQAQQQLQQMAQQAMKQMNNGQGPTQQQQQQVQQMMQQAQAQANAQQKAQQMSQAAKQMAQAMQQAQQPKQGQQQAQSKQGQPQNGQQNPAQQQGMQQAMQQMQQQMQQMAAAQQDAEQIAAAQQGAQAAAQQAMDQMNGQSGNKPGQGDGKNGNQNGGNGQEGNPNQPNQPWNGQANNGMQQNAGGQGAGDRSLKQQAPYQVKQEVSKSQDDEKGRILASTLVKAAAIKGESKETAKEVAASELKDQTEEVDQDRVSRQAQSVVKDYFSTMQQDAEAVAKTPTTAPSK